MFGALLRTRLLAMGSMWFKRSAVGKRSRSPLAKLGFAVLAVYVVGCFIFMFGNMFYALCAPLVSAGLGWLYFALAGIMTFALCFIGSVFTAQKQLFDAQDNDLLLAMPIPPTMILGSRMLMLLALTVAFELLAIVPAGVVYCLLFTPTARGIIVFIVCALFLPLLVMTFSSAFGWLLHVITSRVRNKSLVGMVCSLAFLAAYFYAFSNMNSYLTRLVADSAGIASSLKGGAYPAWAFGSAIADGSVSGLLGWLACCAAPFGMVYIILSKNFIKVTTAKRGAAKIEYKEKAARVRSVPRALMGRELRRFASSAMYMMNAGLGSVFALAAAVAAVIYAPTLREMFLSPEFAGFGSAAAAGALCLVGSTNFVSAPSVSLEGKNLWIIRSMPVATNKVLRAKVNTHIAVTAPPVLIASVVLAVILRPGALAVLGILLAPQLMVLFCAYIGVTFNLLFPRLDFINEVAAVKQSMSTFLSMFGSWAVVGAGVGLYFLFDSFLSAEVYVLLFSVLLLGVSLLLDRWLERGGAKRFEEL